MVGFQAFFSQEKFCLFWLQFGFVREVSPRPWSHSEAPGSLLDAVSQGPLPTGARALPGVGVWGVIIFLWLQNGPQAGRVRVRVGAPLLCLQPAQPWRTVPRGRQGHPRGPGVTCTPSQAVGARQRAARPPQVWPTTVTPRPAPLAPSGAASALSVGEASEGPGEG